VSTEVKVLPPDDFDEGGTHPESPLAENECKDEEAPQEDGGGEESDTGLGFRGLGFKGEGA